VTQLQKNRLKAHPSKIHKKLSLPQMKARRSDTPTASASRANLRR